MVDYWYVSSTLGLNPEEPSKPDLDLIQWGWNAAAARLFTPLTLPGLFPVRRSTPAAQTFASTALHQFGRSILLRRASDMLKAGFLVAGEAGESIEVQQTGEMFGIQAADLTEWNRYEEVGRKYLGERSLFSELRLDKADLKTRMKNLSFPWHTGAGVMAGYNADPEIDDHFFAAAMDKVLRWRDEAGIHPHNVRGGERR